MSTALAMLSRTTFETSRLLEFFSEKELQMQIGHNKALWPVALVKELIDNALDACESAGIAPEITIAVEPDAVSVRDNGPGLPSTTIDRSLDYLVRVSDKAYYVSPTRGQLGNALKCVWAAPFVADGERGRVEVETGGEHHTIDVRLDRIAQEPQFRHVVEAGDFVKNGTLVRMHWPQVASLLDRPSWAGSYTITNIRGLLGAYALFNPHATLAIDDGHTPPRIFWPTDPTWRKWIPSAPTSPHWYTAEHLRDLIAAYLADERRAGRTRTVREFVAEFDGLSGTAKQKAVCAATGLERARLADLVSGENVDIEKVARLLAAMRALSRSIKADALGEIGKDHLTQRLTESARCQAESIRYRRVCSIDDDGLPFVLELAFGVPAQEFEDRGRTVFAGVNWSPSLSLPFRALPDLLGKARADHTDPIVILAHLAKPGPQFTDRGKGVLGDV
jgi:DNA topoisomerase VI subunit B